MKILDEVIEMLQDMVDVADITGSAYLYKRDIPHVKEVIDALKELNKREESSYEIGEMFFDDEFD